MKYNPKIFMIMKKLMFIAAAAIFCLSMNAQTPQKKCDGKCGDKKECKKECKKDGKTCTMDGKCAKGKKCCKKAEKQCCKKGEKK